MKKYEWRKEEKETYLPKRTPQLIKIPPYNFITIRGEGNPNSNSFSECVSALYSVSYAIKMTLKKDHSSIENYIDYAVYPLEGIWDLSEKGKKEYNGVINKDDLVYTIMIRQPEFVTEKFYNEMLDHTRKKKPNPMLSNLKFKTIEDGRCVQMLHIGSFDNEPESFAEMESFCLSEGLKRQSKRHREIYLSDFRKVSEEKLKTVLRFKVD